MTSQREFVFLFDVDNTLLDNDRVESDLRSYVEGRVLIYIHKEQMLADVEGFDSLAELALDMRWT